MPGCCYNEAAAAALDTPHIRQQQQQQQRQQPAGSLGPSDENGAALGSYFSECCYDAGTGKFETTVRGYASYRHGVCVFDYLCVPVCAFLCLCFRLRLFFDCLLTC
eukprot:SAG22_NODE_1644_length_3902_cov_2.850118_3_plen_106_part_00